ncbi:MAG: DUF2127 domain-containing protein [Patescibacteria group bacterium]
MNELDKNRKILHETFELGILVKGIDGILEVIGGALLLLLQPAQINSLIVWLTQHELAQDSHDLLANYLVKLGSNLSLDAQVFGAIYLLIHGVIKVALILGLWKKKLIAYPLAIIFLALFIVYQIYRYVQQPALWLVILSVFDAAMIFLTWAEYRQVKKKLVFLELEDRQQNTGFSTRV